ncbi:hypothetical protein KO02_13360 [Sphingobacterium sp. ML3W]|uniref:AAA family ATPase n=1 Tax=Sphingobacterium sp. ML3W TaxID=1538644 RepID=UPI0004F67956|nr:AAA family ATPase [Sphingobacterium sp. ML3W]AIM37565.1 hypothetical protein KO02_13360 [Sphingobacterium sp. ML3W]
MIYINRKTISHPEIFYSKEIEAAKISEKNFYSRPYELRSQERNLTHLDQKLNNMLRKALMEVFNGRCAYCESQISNSSCDHFSPKNGARGFENEFSNDHYWWLSYEWNNLYNCCLECNRYKSSWFPVKGSRAATETKYNDIVIQEEALLIDPCIDRPQEHLTYNEAGEMVSLTTKGKTTIEIIKLNRSELVEARHRTIQKLKTQWNEFLNLIMRKNENLSLLNEIIYSWGEIFNNQELRTSYLGIQRHFLYKWFKELEIQNNPIFTNFNIFLDNENMSGKALKFSFQEIERSVNRQKITDTTRENNKAVTNLDGIRHIYVEKIELKNFKCFSKLELDFSNNRGIAESKTKQENPLLEPWVLFLGENGVGKSSLLKAIAIGLSGNEYIKSLCISGKEILKHDEKNGYIKIHLVGAINPIIVNFNIDTIISTIEQPIVNVVAYNSIRLKPTVGKIMPENVEFYGAKVKNLFDYTFSLLDAEIWLTKLKEDIFNRVALTLKDLMLL